jgi:dTDP-4-dehydrorhamnose reductase
LPKRDGIMKVFVTGGTGLVGSNVIKVAVEKYGAEVIASRHSSSTAVLPAQFVEMDIRDHERVRRLFVEHKPDLVIHCAATVDTARLEYDHRLGWELMVNATENLVTACRQIDARLIFVSTDWVFDGASPPYREDSIPAPVCYYGFLKVVGETTVRNSGIRYGIARVSAVYGRNWAFPEWEPSERVTGFGTLPNWMLKTLREGGEIAEWTDYLNVRASPTLASDCADAMLRIHERDLTGTFHCSGRACASRVELGRIVADTFGFEPSRVREATEAEMQKPGELLPLYTCLDVSATEAALDRINIPVTEGIAVWKEQLSE